MVLWKISSISNLAIICDIGGNMDGFLTIQEQNATEEIRSSLLTFGEDVLKTKFPSYMDGFKDITRRIIWFSKDYKESKGMNKVMGDIMDFHVSGDSSVYGAIIRLAQPFMVGHPLIEIDGKKGEYFDPSSAAAARYLKTKLSEFSKDVFFNGVNLKTIPMVATKDYSAMEPRYLIPRLPMALVLGNLTVGFGFKSHSPLIDFADVCDLVMAFAEYYQKGGAGIPKNIAKHLIPTFPILNIIKNRDELYRSYINDDYNKEISMEGWADISGSNIILRTVPYGTDFGTMTSKLRNQMRDRKHWLWDYIVGVNQYSSDTAELSIEVKRGKNPFEVFDKLKPVIHFNNNWHPIYSYMKDGRALALNPAVLTYLWYQERAISIAGGLKYKQTDLIYRQMVLQAMLVVVEHSKEVIRLIEESDDEEDAVKRLYERFKELTWNQAKIVSQQRISTLAKSNRKQIESELEQVAVDLESTVKSFSRINEIIYTDAQFLKKKYKTTRESRFSNDFIGYVQFGDWGITHFFDYEEMYELLNSKWPTHVKKTIHLYDSKAPVKYAVQNGKLNLLTELSKDINCEAIVCYPYDKSELTLAIGSDKSTCVVERSVTGIYGDHIICPISKKFYGIHRNGAVTAEDVQSFSIRKNISKGAKTDLIYGLSDKSNDLVVIHMNTTEPNTLRIDRILFDGKIGSLKTVPTGDMHLLGIYPINSKEFILNVPDSCRKINSEFIIVKNIKKLFESGKNNHLINLAKTSNKRLKRNNQVRSLFVLDFEIPE